MGSNNPHIHTVRDGALYRHDGTLVCRVGLRTGWLDWLQNPAHKSFAFVADNGAHCTVVKERRVGASGNEHFYWFAYRSVHGKKRRVSLGKSAAVTLQRLTQAATRLAQLELPATTPSFDILAEIETAPAGENMAEMVTNQGALFGTRER